jgi:hypothetical protein
VLDGLYKYIDTIFLFFHMGMKLGLSHMPRIFKNRLPSCRLKEEKTSRLCGTKEKRNTYRLSEETLEGQTQAKMGG